VVLLILRHVLVLSFMVGFASNHQSYGNHQVRYALFKPNCPKHLNPEPARSANISYKNDAVIFTPSVVQREIIICY